MGRPREHYPRAWRTVNDLEAWGGSDAAELSRFRSRDVLFGTVTPSHHLMIRMRVGIA